MLSSAFILILLFIVFVNVILGCALSKRTDAILELVSYSACWVAVEYNFTYIPTVSQQVLLDIKVWLILIIFVALFKMRHQVIL